MRASRKGVILFCITIFPSWLSILVPIQSRLPYFICSTSVLVFLGQGRAFGTQQLPASLDPDIQPHRPESMPSALRLPPVSSCVCVSSLSTGHIQLGRTSHISHLCGLPTASKGGRGRKAFECLLLMLLWPLPWLCTLCFAGSGGVLIRRPLSQGIR